MALPVPVPNLFRVINPRDFDTEKGRFSSLAFRPSSNACISVVECECAVAESGSICAHIRRFYSDQTEPPGIYWNVPPEDVPANCIIEETASSTGDKCHRDIHGWPAKAVRKYFIQIAIEEMLICSEDGVRHLSQSDLEV
jgi:hypothetical protein